MKIFSKDGRLIIPLAERKIETKKNEDKVRYIIDHAYYPNGCDIIDPHYEINGFSGIRIKYKRLGVQGEFVLSAIEGDFVILFYQASY